MPIKTATFWFDFISRSVNANRNNKTLKVWQTHHISNIKQQRSQCQPLHQSHNSRVMINSFTCAIYNSPLLHKHIHTFTKLIKYNKIHSFIRHATAVQWVKQDILTNAACRRHAEIWWRQNNGKWHYERTYVSHNCRNTRISKSAFIGYCTQYNLATNAI